MRIQFFLNLFFIQLFIWIPSQKIQLNLEQDNAIEWERILSAKQISESDTTSLKNFLQPLKERNSISDQVIYDLLLANCYAKYFDGINSKSNLLYRNAIINSRKLDRNTLEIWVNLSNAEYLSTYKKLTSSLPFYVRAMNIIEDADSSQMLFPAESYSKIGYFLIIIGDYTEAIKYLTKAIKVSKTNTSEFARLKDKIGFCYYKLGNLPKAQKNIEEASALAKLIGDDLRYAKARGNLALIYEQKQDLKTATKLALEDIEISERQNNMQNSMLAYTILTRLYIASNDIEKAKITAEKAVEIAQSQSYLKINELEILKLQLEIIKKEKKSDGELYVRRRINVLEDSLNKTDGILPQNQANLLMQKRNYQRIIDKSKVQYRQKATQKNLIYIGIGLSFMVLLFFIIILRNKIVRNKIQNDKKIKEYQETEIINQQNLLNANKTLDYQIHFLKEKNLEIKKMYVEIEKLKELEFSSQDKNHEKINSLLQSHLMTDENWRNFKTEFQRTYPEFFNTLKQDFPELTSSNIRIILLQKLGFSNCEISGLLGITFDAVKKSKQRLKKKLGSKYEHLFTMISSEN